MTGLVYFAYGSNMSTRRLLARIPGAVRLGNGRLDGYALRFHKVSDVDGSAKCDIERVDEGCVHGVLFSMTANEKAMLDDIEGLHAGYDEILVEIQTGPGERLRATAYQATVRDAALKPWSWYKRHVLEGALEAALPPSYVALIERVADAEDPDNARTKRELALYIRRRDD